VKRATLSSKCQITVPAWIRRRLGIGPGDKVTFSIRHGEVVIDAEPRSASSFRGVAAGVYGDPGAYVREQRGSWDR
jgi:AbrB family looped-hinge helix DNA binding protein